MRKCVLGGILISAEAVADLVYRSCQKPLLIKDLDLDRFLGRWYEIYRDHDSVAESGECVVIDAEKNAARTQITGRLAQYPLNGGGWFSSSTKWTTMGRNIKFSDYKNLDIGWLDLPVGEVRLLATDYDNYAVAYMCVGFGSWYSQEDIWLLSREPTLAQEHIEEAIKVIRKKLPKYDWNHDARRTTQGDRCPYDKIPPLVTTRSSEYEPSSRLNTLSMVVQDTQSFAYLF